MKIQNVKARIASGNLEDVLNELVIIKDDEIIGSYKNDFMLLKAQFYNIKKELNLCFVTKSEYEVKVSKITYSLLCLVQEIEKGKLYKPLDSISINLKENAYNKYLTGYTLLHQWKKKNQARLYLEEARSSFIEHLRVSFKDSEAYLLLLKTLKQLFRLSFKRGNDQNDKLQLEVEKYLTLGRKYDTDNQYDLQFARISREVKVITSVIKYWYVILIVLMTVGGWLFYLSQGPLKQQLNTWEYLIMPVLLGLLGFFLVEEIIVKNKKEVKR